MCMYVYIWHGHVQAWVIFSPMWVSGTYLGLSGSAASAFTLSHLSGPRQLFFNDFSSFLVSLKTVSYQHFFLSTACAGNDSEFLRNSNSALTVLWDRSNQSSFSDQGFEKVSRPSRNTPAIYFKVWNEIQSQLRNSNNNPLNGSSHSKHWVFYGLCSDCVLLCQAESTASCRGMEAESTASHKKMEAESIASCRRMEAEAGTVVGIFEFNQAVVAWSLCSSFNQKTLFLGWNKVVPPWLTLKSPVAQVTCSVNGLTANIQKAAEPGTLKQVMKGNYDYHVPLPSFVEDRRTWSPSESFCDLFVTSNHNTCKVNNIALGNKCCEKYIFKKIWYI